MSPTTLYRRDCDLFGNNCNDRVRPSTYAASVAIRLSSISVYCLNLPTHLVVVLFIIFATCFIQPLAPINSISRPAPPPGPPPVFEPAPPYDPTAYKAPAPPDPRLQQSQAGPAPPPVQYPPPSYSPS
ncbi:hypothetical protein D9615_004480 [Tricholomella constricta]|uniref:Uncharacterized protein n=1 Tax=Tricholomella constricta TaxID=117010 RepID=A0A8H5HC04_9AGAR|nr:hypothetical protein D9615_004480 [Tricholomella constricta]